MVITTLHKYLKELHDSHILESAEERLLFHITMIYLTAIFYDDRHLCADRGPHHYPGAPSICHVADVP